MSRTVIPYKIGDSQFVIDQIARLYSHPHLAFKEYISNSIDNKTTDLLEIGIVVNKKDGRIIIQDNGHGIDIESLAKIPTSIGFSSKRGFKTSIGEKGFGLLAYPSVGASQCQVFTRIENDSMINYLQMIKGKDSAIVEQKSPSELLYGDFAHGTQVVLHGISEDFISRYFTPSHIKSLVSSTFSPLLRNNIVKVKVGYLGKGEKLIPIQPQEYSGEQVLEDKVEIEYIKDDKLNKGILEFYLFINPKGTSEKVNYFNKGVLVLKSISSLDELSDLPWSSGKLSGEINEDFLSLIPSREAPIREGAKFNAFIDLLKEQEEYLNEEINRLKIRATRHRCSEFATQFLKAIDAIYKELSFTSPPPRSRTSSSTGFSGDSTKNLESNIQNNTEHQDSKENSSEKPIGNTMRQSSVKQQENESVVKIPRTRRIISALYTPHFDSFDLDKNHLRSELDHTYGHVRINQEHDDFMAAQSNPDKKALDRYIGLLLSKEIAIGELSKRTEQGVGIPHDDHTLSEMVAEIYIKGLRKLNLE